MVGLLTGVFCSAFFFWLGLSQRKPKLVESGAGSGAIRIPNRDVMASTISIRNEPSIFGMKTPRDAATVESARLYDPEIKEFFGPPLVWRQSGTSQCASQITIESGKHADLLVFAKDRHSREYFVFSGDALDKPLPAHPTVRSHDKRSYEVHLFDSIGRQYRFSIVARNNDQSVDVSFKFTLRNRLRMIARGFRMIRAAFRVGSG